MVRKLVVRGAVLGACIAVVGLALAQPGRTRRLTDIVDASAPVPPGNPSPPGLTDAAPPGQAKHPESKAKNSEYHKRTGPIISSTIRSNGKAFTQEEKDLISKHENRVAVIFKIRGIAEDENPKDTGTIGRCDALLQREEPKFFEKLRKLNAKAPAAAVDGGAK